MAAELRRARMHAPLQGRTLTTAWVGDSRGVMARQTEHGWEAIDLTDDHKPTNPEEKARIQAHNGRVERCVQRERRAPAAEGAAHDSVPRAAAAPAHLRRKHPARQRHTPAAARLRLRPAGAAPVLRRLFVLCRLLEHMFAPQLRPCDCARLPIAPACQLCAPGERVHLLCHVPANCARLSPVCACRYRQTQTEN